MKYQAALKNNKFVGFLSGNHSWELNAQAKSLGVVPYGLVFEKDFIR